MRSPVDNEGTRQLARLSSEKSELEDRRIDLDIRTGTTSRLPLSKRQSGSGSMYIMLGRV